ncbi:Cilia- and flagella-associated protein 43 [Sparganum proliferum]
MAVQSHLQQSQHGVDAENSDEMVVVKLPGKAQVDVPGPLSLKKCRHDENFVDLQLSIQLEAVEIPQGVLWPFEGLTGFETRWLQGNSDKQAHFINQHTVCVKAGKTIRFIHENAENTAYIHQGNTQLILAVHPIEPVFALAETDVKYAKVFLVTYPAFERKLIGDTESIEVVHLKFSHGSLLACISSIPRSVLTLWDFRAGLQLCRASLNSRVDPETAAMGVVYNPNLPASGLAEYADTINNDPPRSGFSECDLESMVFTTDGLLAGGRDSTLRLLNLQSDQETDSSVGMGIVAPNRQTATCLPPGSSFVTLLGHLMHAQLVNLDELLDVNDPYPITHISMSPTFNKMLVVRENGGLYIYKMLRVDGILQQIDLQKNVMGCHNPFVGVGVVTVGRQVFCVALCMRALPGIPVVLVGLSSGHVQFVDFSVPDAPRLLRSIRFYKKPVRGIFTDQHGDIIVITAKDEKIFLVSGDPGRNFEPLGYLDPEAHRNAKSHEIRSDLLGLITLTIMLPLSGAFMNVIEPPENVKAEMRDEEPSLGGLVTSSVGEETEGNEEHSDKDSASPPPPVVTLYSLDQVSHEIAIINLTQAVAVHGATELLNLHVHQCSGAGVVEAAITPDMGLLVTGGSDGLLCAIPLGNKLPKVPSGVLEALAMNSKGKLKALQELQTYAPVNQSANAYTTSADGASSDVSNGNQLNFNQNAGEDSASKNTSGRPKNMPVGGGRAGTRQIQRQKSVMSFEAFLPKDFEEVDEESESQDPTWLEEEMMKQQREDVKTLTSTKEQIVAELERLKSAASHQYF